MRNTTLFAFLLFMNALIAQEIFNQKIIAKNKVERISSFTPVPNTHPEYYNKPIGFMRLADHYFNTHGQRTRSIYYNGSCASSIGCADLIETFTYKNDRLVKMHQTGLDTIDVSYLYYPDKFRALELTTNTKNERISLNFIYKDLFGRDLSSYEISFDNVTPENGDVHMSIWKSSFFLKNRRLFIKANYYRISMNQLKILRFSKNITQLESCLKKIEQQLIMEWMPMMKFQAFHLYICDTNGNLTKDIVNPEKGPDAKQKSVYFYNENGLLVKSFDCGLEYTSWCKYRYVFRKN